ncbi:MAG: hypothetical protein ACI4S9_07625 [Christensenellales bacterium]
MKKRFFLLILIAVCFAISGIGIACAEGHTIIFENKLILNIDVTDDALIYSESGESGVYSNVRFCNYGGAFVYKVQFPQNAVNAYMRANYFGESFFVAYSVDGVIFSDLSYEGITTPSGKTSETDGADYKDGNVYYFDLTEELDGQDTVYIRFSGKDTSKESVIQLSELSFYAATDNSPYVAAEGETCAVQYAYVTDTEYLINDSYSMNEDYVYCDNDKTLTYKFNKKVDRTTGVEISVYAYAGYYISVSADNETWKDLGIADIKYYEYKLKNYLDGGNYGIYVFDVSDYIGTDYENIYVRLGDFTYQNGFGGCYKYVVCKEYYIAGSETYDIISRGELVADVPVAADAYVYSQSGNSVNGPSRIVKNAEDYFVYKLNFPDGTSSFAVSMQINGNLKLSYSYDGTDFTELRNADYFVSGSQYVDGTSYTANLTDILNSGSDKNLYLKFQNGATSENPFSLTRMIIVYNDSALYKQNENYYETEYIEYLTCAGVDDSEYLYEKYSDGTIVGTRFFDRMGYGIYKFNYKSGDGVKIQGIMMSSYYLQYSLDGETWYYLSVCDDIAVDNLTAGKEKRIYADITDNIKNLTQSETISDGIIYVKVGDVVTDTGSGGRVRSLGVISYSGETDNFTVNTPDFPNKTTTNSCSSSSVPILMILGICVTFVGFRLK